MNKTIKTFGLWQSPISPEMIGDSLKLNDVFWDSQSDTLVWSERRGKQSILVAKTGDDASRDLTDSRYSPSGRVGYGGGEFTVHNSIVYFVHEGRLYRLPLSGGLPKAITPKFGGAASPTVSPDGKWIAFVHSYEHKDAIAVVDTKGKQWAQKIASGDDFVMQPTWSPDGQHLAYIAWNHPQMPWNGTELRLIHLLYEGNGTPFAQSEETLAGSTETAIFQPQFSPDGRYLAYASDATGWWHLYLYEFATGESHQLTHDTVEHGIPAWIQGMRTYAWSADSKTIYAIRHDKAFYSIWQIDIASRDEQRITALDDYTHFAQIAVSTDNQIAVIAASSIIPTRVITFSDSEGVKVIRRSTTESVPEHTLSACEAITWTGHDGEDAHGLYYPPKNNGYEDIGKPPLMVLVHGGPTSQRNATFDMEVQFFTSRGFAVLQVNHRGSTGYGKAYMNAHAGNWGVYDVQDSITGTQYLVDNNLADSAKLVIMGGSAGGYTALQALVDAPNFFKAAVVSYGIANQFSLVMDTHKFEERYSDWLLGTLPEAADKYRDRSPLFHAEKINDAVIIFQGTEDNVVPKNQSDSIVAALQRGGVPHEYVVYEGEGHGFRKPETKVDFYERVLKFLKQYVIFT